MSWGNKIVKCALVAAMREEPAKSLVVKYCTLLHPEVADERFPAGVRAFDEFFGKRCHLSSEGEDERERRLEVQQGGYKQLNQLRGGDGEEKRPCEVLTVGKKGGERRTRKIYREQSSGHAESRRCPRMT